MTPETGGQTIHPVAREALPVLSKALNIFELHAKVIADYRDFVRSFFSVADERAREFIERALVEEAKLWPDFLLQLSPSYARGESVDDLAAAGALHAETARVFRAPDDKPYVLYQHQLEALNLALAGKSYVVTSGTGSGKSLAYFLPIIDNLIRQPATGDRVAALIVYPMNALVNSQLQALESLKAQYEKRTGARFPVTFAKYTGETNDAARDTLRQHPPQIMLTNYVMTELLLVRPEDQRFLDRAGGGLRFLVFDELHTYRGRQGADVAMLIRRLKERCAAPNLVHVGTKRHDGRRAHRNAGNAARDGRAVCAAAFRPRVRRRTGRRGNADRFHRGRCTIESGASRCALIMRVERHYRTATKPACALGGSRIRRRA